jgi:hypothetical protein
MMVCELCNLSPSTVRIKMCHDCEVSFKNALNRHNTMMNELDSLRQEFRELRELFNDILTNKKYKLLMLNTNVGWAQGVEKESPDLSESK